MAAGWSPRRCPVSTGVASWIAAMGLCLRLAGIEAAATTSDGYSPDDLEFFEKRIRPVLVDRCFSCHSHDSEKLKGGLHLDSREGLLRGGETKPAAVPGKPEESLLINAVRYGDQKLQMPPKGRLSEREVSDLAEWVRRGLPWPKDPAGKEDGSTAKTVFDLSKRMASHWSWKPIHRPPVPVAKNPAWARNAVDLFIAGQNEKRGLSQATEAEKSTILRRLFSDLIGLPPSPEQIKAFVNDPDAMAYEKVVDSLLASPHFGERWARHGLDLVRYAETLGHEFDYARQNAWRYRDYVIRALNSDVPYDQFVREHIAGDLLETPRLNPADESNESLIGTAFFWLGQQVHSPVDIRVHQADMIDNQIDVFSKTFMGLTIACARCHDHKFDAITTRDFYSLFGIFSSSRYSQSPIDKPGSRTSIIRELSETKRQIKSAVAASWKMQIEEVLQSLEPSGPSNSRTPQLQNQPVKHPLTERWLRVLDSSRTNQMPWLHPPLAEVRTHRSPSLHRTQKGKEMRVASGVSGSLGTNWFATGWEFDEVSALPGDFEPGAGSRPVKSIITSPSFRSALLSKRLQGTLRSPTFVIQSNFVHLFAAGKDTRLNVVIDNFTMIQAPIYGSLRKVLDFDQLQWITIDLTMWKGHRAYLELADLSVGDPAGGGKASYGEEGCFAVHRVVFKDEASPPTPTNQSWNPLAEGDPEAGGKERVAQLAAALLKAVKHWSQPTPDEEGLPGASLALLEWARHNELWKSESESGQAGDIGRLLQRYQEIESRLKPPSYTPAMAEGTGMDEAVFIRGNPKNPGQPVPRRFIEALHPPGAAAFSKKNGSGRAELAQHVLALDNPFAARVMANRVWAHLFGRGIVASTDDFGALGQPPSNPELLDWIADYFRTDANWSVKNLIRFLVKSSTYRMASQKRNDRAEEVDPENILLHRMTVKRLEAEAIRDSILAISGRLDRKMMGPSVPTHLTAFMEGRGRPGKSGPLDGNGRRSVYLEVRNNFLMPMMRTFDAPIPFTTIGKRTTSNVPAQSLILMNDPFIREQAALWAKRTLRSSHRSTEERLNQLFKEIFARSPKQFETQQIEAFLLAQSAVLGRATGGEHSSTAVELWTDVCHALLNAKELIYVQ